MLCTMYVCGWSRSQFCARCPMQRFNYSRNLELVSVSYYSKPLYLADTIQVVECDKKL